MMRATAPGLMASGSKTPVSRQLQIGFARTLQSVGWAGILGGVLLAVAGSVLELAWIARSSASLHPLPLHTDKVPSALVRSAAADSRPQIVRDLAPVSDVPLLLTQIKQIALGNGLGWSAADYRLTPATDTHPPSLEVRSNFKAPYPQLRSMVSQVLREVPAATLRELSLSRASGDLADVDAKIVIAVILQDTQPISARTLTVANTKAKPSP